MQCGVWRAIISRFVFAYPISRVLDVVLGGEVSATYTKRELLSLISMNIKNTLKLQEAGDSKLCDRDGNARRSGDRGPGDLGGGGGGGVPPSGTTKTLAKPITGSFSLRESKRDKPQKAGDGGLTVEDGRLLAGALTFREKTVFEIMTPLETTFSLPESSVRATATRVVRGTRDMRRDRPPTRRRRHGSLAHVIACVCVCLRAGGVGGG